MSAPDNSDLGFEPSGATSHDDLGFAPSGPGDSGPPAPPTLNAASTGAMHAARHLTSGLGDKLTAAGEAASELLHDKTGKHSFGELYQNNLAQNDQLLDDSDKVHPTARWVGNALGVAGNLAALGPAFKAGSVLTGVGTGLAQGFGGDRSESAAGTAANTALSGLAGGAAAYATPYVAAYVGKIGGLVQRGLITPSEAAAFLRSKGVPLTLGQMNPGGVMSKLEEAGQHSILGGHAIADAQGAAREGFQNAVLNEARGPVPSALRPGSAADKLAGVYEDFKPAYAAVRDTPVQALGTVGSPNALAPLGEAFEHAASDPSTYATDAEVAAAKRFLANQATPKQLGLSALPENGSPPLTKAGSLLDARANIRGAIRDAMRRQDTTAASLLGNAEDSLTGGLEQQLPADAAQSLKSADSAYSRYKIVEDAVRRSGDQPNGFTPAQLSAAIKAASERGDYARGGGQLRDLAQAGNEVLNARQPSTGAKLLTAGPFNHLAGPVAAIANRPAIQRALLGETAWQGKLGELASSGAARAAGAAASNGVTQRAPELLLNLAKTNFPELAARVGQGPASVLTKATQDYGDDGFATHHFILSQTQPAYSQAVSAMADEQNK